MRRITADLFRIMAATGLLATTAASLPPKDECAKEPGFEAFRAELKKVVAARDDKKLMTFLAPDILVGFASDNGHEWFRKNWGLDTEPPKQSSVWPTLNKMLSYGCAKGEDFLAMPYLYQRIPDNYDAFDVVVALGPDIPMREAPRADAKLVRALNWDIVNAEGSDAPDDWIKLRTDDGVTGYALRDQVHSPIDYRIVFNRKNGKWLITAFLAGD